MKNLFKFKRPRGNLMVSEVLELDEDNNVPGGGLFYSIRGKLLPMSWLTLTITEKTSEVNGGVVTDYWRARDRVRKNRVYEITHCRNGYSNSHYLVRELSASEASETLTYSFLK